MQVPDLGKITTDEISHSLLQTKNIQLDILRLDKIHPVISGNKWFVERDHESKLIRCLIL